jgi:hypothetical protein
MLNKKALAASVSAPPAGPDVEDVFSAFLSTGTGAARTVTNGIDLAGEGGLVWSKARSISQNNTLIDTVRGNGSILYSDSTNSADTGVTTGITAFSSTGYSLGTGSFINQSSEPYVSWTFREQPKFFDVVTYTGNSTAGRTVAHNLGSVPGMMIVKRTDAADGWTVYHRSIGATTTIFLNDSGAQQGANSAWWNNTTPTSTVFTVGSDDSVNANGGTYVAYLFAHDAGGFGTSGTDNVISCGSFTTTTSSTIRATVNLGYEPQFVLFKPTSTTGNWQILDTMRGWSTQGDNTLRANLSDAEVENSSFGNPTSTGFEIGSSAAQNATHIYMAIRRPMKVPTTGTEVFSATTAQPVSGVMQSSVLTDLQIAKWTGGTQEWFLSSRLQGGAYLATNSTQAEGAVTYKFDKMTGTTTDALGDGFYLSHSFKRASGFMDVVCYTGTGTTGQVINHNLSVVPEMVIIKARNGTSEWFVYHTGLSSGNSFYLNRNYAQGNDGGPAFSLSSTTITFDRTYVSNINSSGANYVAHLLATLAGISKVGSYTGNGSNQTINCGFTAGARFVLIKRTDSTGDWCVFDTARGIVSGNDPFLQLNSSAAEVTGEDAVDPANSGFIVNETTEALNTNAATYIFLAIA